MEPRPLLAEHGSKKTSLEPRAPTETPADTKQASEGSGNLSQPNALLVPLFEHMRAPAASCTEHLASHAHLVAPAGTHLEHQHDLESAIDIQHCTNMANSAVDSLQQQQTCFTGVKQGQEDIQDVTGGMRKINQQGLNYIRLGLNRDAGNGSYRTPTSESYQKQLAAVKQTAKALGVLKLTLAHAAIDSSAVPALRVLKPVGGVPVEEPKALLSTPNTLIKITPTCSNTKHTLLPDSNPQIGLEVKIRSYLTNLIHPNSPRVDQKSNSTLPSPSPNKNINFNPKNHLKPLSIHVETLGPAQSAASVLRMDQPRTQLSSPTLPLSAASQPSSQTLSQHIPTPPILPLNSPSLPESSLLSPRILSLSPYRLPVTRGAAVLSPNRT